MSGDAGKFIKDFAHANIVEGPKTEAVHPALAWAAKYVDLEETPLNVEKMPKHIAIVMDGNGRWATSRNMPRTFGHRQGVLTVETIVTAACELGIEYLTVYAFSTENWKRPKEEVGVLMSLLIEFAEKKLRKLCENRVRVNVLGDMDGLPKEVQTALYGLMDATAENPGLTLNLALNYGGRQDILQAAAACAKDLAAEGRTLEDCSEEEFSRYLYTADQPDPELMIRTSGEQRLSNYLLWQLAYAEFYFTDALWPDFDEVELIRAISAYQHRDRRFGGLK